MPPRQSPRSGALNLSTMVVVSIVVLVAARWVTGRQRAQDSAGATFDNCFSTVRRGCAIRWNRLWQTTSASMTWL